MRTRPHHLLGGTAIATAWGAVTISTWAEWPERLHETLIGAAICISVYIGIAFIAVGNRWHYHRDHDNLCARVDTLRHEVDTIIKASHFGQALASGGAPFRALIPDGPVKSRPVTGENAIVGVREDGVVDLDAVRDAIRRTES